VRRSTANKRRLKPALLIALFVVLAAGLALTFRCLDARFMSFHRTVVIRKRQAGDFFALIHRKIGAAGTRPRTQESLENSPDYLRPPQGRRCEQCQKSAPGRSPSAGPE
jgi:hypothetical protein